MPLALLRGERLHERLWPVERPPGRVDAKVELKVMFITGLIKQCGDREFDLFSHYTKVGLAIHCAYIVSLMMAFGVFSVLFFTNMDVQRISARPETPQTSSNPSQELAIQNLQDRMSEQEGKMTADEQTLARIADNLDDVKVKQAEQSIEIESINKTLWEFLIPFILMVVKELSVFALWFVGKKKGGPLS